MARNDSRSKTLGFLIVGGLGVAGTMVGQLGATSATTYASDGNGGLNSGIFLGLMLTFAGFSAVWARKFAARWGELRTFVAAQACIAISWSTVGVVETLTNSSLIVLWSAAPVFGLLSGITAILTPFVVRSYVDPVSMTKALARRGIASGICAILGASLGGFLIAKTDPGVGVLANGLLTIPITIFTARIPPLAQAKPLKPSSTSTRATFLVIRTNRRIRGIALLVLASTLLVVPMLTMMVPILNDIDHAPLPSGAGLVVAGIAAGRLIVPALVTRLLRKREEFAAAHWAVTWASGFMIAFAIVAGFFSSRWDLLLWTLIGFGLGASRFTFRTLILGAATQTGPRHDEIAGMTAAILVGTLASPLGVLLWGVSIEYLSATITIAVAGTVMLLVVLAFVLRGTKPSDRESSSDAATTTNQTSSTN